MLPARPFYLIRHGQSEANVARITAGGQLDSALTEKGHGQGQSLAKLIDQIDIKPGIIYHSDMQRARNTAHHLNKALNLEMHERHDLREHDMGVWDGQPWDNIEPQLIKGVVPEGGESEFQFSVRIKAALTDILNRKNEGLPMVVAHGGLFHSIGFMYEYAMSDIQNCHLHYFEPNTEWPQFPWRVTMYDIEGAKLVKRPAPFCVSQRMELAS